ncbi:hypothetical protein [Streptomyces sp. Ncost-T10-10d]|uniref:hypothetical protein n=1 Tax=Streptomyces sp. Ncost-T10-10d TaxID=1839774 RepID=UPI00081E1F7B|nr:hypothetical protein GA0115254_1216164 [Streptomyces sp. Ncost-T10-10d]
MPGVSERICRPDAVIGFIASAGSLVWGMGAVAAPVVLVSLCATQIRWPSLVETKPDPSVLT